MSNKIIAFQWQTTRECVYLVRSFDLFTP